MRDRIRERIRKICKWILLVLGYRIIVIPEDFDIVLPAVKLIVERVEELSKGKAVNDEWKRHQAYAKAIKTFPQIDKRVLGTAIEIVGWQKI